MRAVTAGLAAVAVVATIPFALAGCGSEEAELAGLVPADSPLYVEGVVRPEGDQAAAITVLTERVGGITDPGGEVIAQLDASFESGGTELTYAEDVEPWLGTRGAFFLSGLEGLAEGGEPDGAAMVETTDADAAQQFVDDAVAEGTTEFEDASYEDIDYKLGSDGTAIGLVEDFLVVGTEPGFQAVVDTAGGDEALVDSHDFDEQLSALDAADPLLSAYADAGAALDAAIASGATTEEDAAAARALAGDALEEPFVLTAEANEDSVAVDVSSPSTQLTPAGTEGLLDGLPAESWFAYGLGDAGAALGELLTAVEEQGESLGDPSLTPGAIAGQFEAATGLDLEADVLDVIGDFGLSVSGTSESQFRLLAELAITDPEAAATALDSLSGAVEDQGLDVGPPPKGADGGFVAESPQGTVEVALAGESLEAEIAGADAPEPSGTLADSELFGEASEALGEDFSPQTFIGVQDFLVVAEKGDDDHSTDYDAARPYTENLSYAIVGTRSDDDRAISRLVVGVE